MAVCLRSGGHPLPHAGAVFSPLTGNQLSDAIAEGTMRTLIRNAYLCAKEPDNYAARSEIM